MEPRLTGVRAVLFDLGDTLFRLEPLDLTTVYERFACLLSERCGLPAEVAASQSATFSRTLESAYRQLQQSGSTAEPSVAEQATPLLSAFGAEASWLADQLDDLVGEADIARWRLPPDRAEEVARFRSLGLGIAFVSNTLTRPPLMRRRLAEFGLLELADTAVFSVEVGERKPGERIYRAALDALGVEASSALFVGDRVREDVLGPQSLGMHAVLTHEFRQEDPASAQPSAVIPALPALRDLL